MIVRDPSRLSPRALARAEAIEGSHGDPAIVDRALAGADSVEMMVAKDQGLDNAEPRTPESTTPTSFRQWCEAVLRPALTA